MHAMSVTFRLRGSVMVGTALNKAEMRKVWTMFAWLQSYQCTDVIQLIDHMAEMDQPWVS